MDDTTKQINTLKKITYASIAISLGCVVALIVLSGRQPQEIPLEVSDQLISKMMEKMPVPAAGSSAKAVSVKGEVTDSLQTKKVVIVDGSGNAVMTLEGSKNGGSITLRNSKGQEVFRVYPTGAGNGTFAIYNNGGTQIMAAGGSERGDGLMVLNSAGKKKLFYLGASGDGDGSLKVFSAKGGEVFTADSTPSGNGRVNVMSSGGRPVVTLAASDSGNGGVDVRNSSEKQVVALGTAKGGHGLVRVSGGGGQDVVKLGASDDGKDGTMNVQSGGEWKAAKVDTKK
ncbi:MAG: hypothetical protein OEV94_05610 [Deltaproteobacteria bacterium]|nr:hypothetical protein [Deltaproteobacteria bacterium]